MVYFFKVGDYVKIGYSKNPKQRASRLKTDNPYDLEILHIVKGDWTIERAYQEMYKDFHHRGDWFHYDSSMDDIPINIKPCLKQYKIGLETRVEECIHAIDSAMLKKEFVYRGIIPYPTLWKYVYTEQVRDYNVSNFGTVSYNNYLQGYNRVVKLIDVMSSKDIARVLGLSVSTVDKYKRVFNNTYTEQYKSKNRVIKQAILDRKDHKSGIKD